MNLLRTARKPGLLLWPGRLLRDLPKLLRPTTTTPPLPLPLVLRCRRRRCRRRLHRDLLRNPNRVIALRTSLRISSHRSQSLILILHGRYRISVLIVVVVAISAVISGGGGGGGGLRSRVSVSVSGCRVRLAY